MNKPVVWTISGSDSSTGAGIHTDLRAFNAVDVHGCAITTAITAQNNNQINQIQYTPIEFVLSQISTLEKTFLPKAIKLGMLGSIDLINILRLSLQKHAGKIVLDPVLISSSGVPLFKDLRSSYIQHLKTLFPLIEVLTPNIEEAELLLNRNIHSPSQIEAAALDFISLGVKNIVIKGGHMTNSKLSQDYWSNGNESFWLHSKRYSYQQIRGTGCTFASAIAACLALDYSINDAVVIAKMLINQGIRQSYAINQAQHLVINTWPENPADLPTLSNQFSSQLFSFQFRHIEKQDLLGIYPVVDNAQWLTVLLPQGVKIIQLRIKDKQGLALENEIKHAVAIANRYSAKLFINDYWELAIKYNAYGVHLGQDDILSADLPQLQAAGLRVGISTHCYYEVARAHHLQPSYMACGPIYATTSKMMPFQPQGIEQLHRWRRTLSYPLVAIGGINLERLSEVLSTGVEGIAVLSAITRAIDPVAMAQQFINHYRFRRHYHPRERACEQIKCRVD